MVLDISGVKDFRLCFAVSLLSNNSLNIAGIRSESVDPGLREHEIKYLELLTELTQGSIIEISDDGTGVSFSPGIIRGGSFEFDCGATYSMAYFIEPLFLLVLFAKFPTKITFSGLTCDKNGSGMDCLKYFYDPLLELLGLSKNITIKICSRGYLPEGRGKVLLECVPVQRIDSFNFIPSDKVTKVRGILASTKVNNQICSTIISQTKEILTEYFSDIFIYTDSKSFGDKASPGFSLALVGTNTASNHVITVEMNSSVIRDISNFPTSIANVFLKKVAKNAYIDQERLWIVLSFACIANGVSSLDVARPDSLPESVISLLEHGFGVKFSKRKGSHSEALNLKCLGIGLSNIAQEFK